MEKDKIFFGEGGITSTSANHCANVAKEMYQYLQNELFLMKLYTTEVSLIDSSEKKLLREGNKDIATIEEKLTTIAQLKSLIAWLREAISAKERLIKEASSKTYEDFGLKVPEEPVRKEYITEDDVISSWNIKQRNRYYYLEALCATIGGYIHPGNPFANERQEFLKILSQPNELKGNGRDTLLYTYTPSVNPSEVEETFLHLQQVYRGYQAELNSMKYQVETALQEDKSAKNAAYSQKMKDYTGEMSLINARLREYVHTATMEAQNLKIIIPDSLKPVFDKVQKAGK